MAAIIDSHSLSEYPPIPDRLMAVGAEQDTDEKFREIVVGLGSVTSGDIVKTTYNTAKLDPRYLLEMMEKHNALHPIDDYERSVYSPESQGF